MRELDKVVKDAERVEVEEHGILGGISGMVNSILGGVSDLVTSVIGEAKRSPRSTRRCPCCAETVLSEAIKCRYCGAELAAE